MNYFLLYNACYFSFCTWAVTTWKRALACALILNRCFDPFCSHYGVFSASYILMS